MARKTIKQLETDLKNMEFLYNQELEENKRLKNELAGKNVISKLEYDTLKKDFENMKDMRNQYKSLHDDLLDSYYKLKESSLEINNRTKYKPRNERGAGRKAFNNVFVIKKIYELYLEGNSLQKICDVLEGLEIKTNRNKKFNKSTIRYILKNKKNVANGYIPIDVFKRVEIKLNSKGTITPL